MPATPKWGLRYPPATGAKPGAFDIENLAKDLENLALPLVGLNAAKPSAAATPIGRKYWATDTNTYHVNSGASWVQIPTNFEYGLNVWRDVPDAPRAFFMAASASGSAALHFMSRSGGFFSPIVNGSTGSFGTNVSLALHRINPTEFEIPGRPAPQFRLRSFIMVNATAPARTFTVGLHALTSIGAAGGVANITANFNDTPVTSSDHQFVSPPANTYTILNSSAFSIASADYYMPMCRMSGASAAGSTVWIVTRLQVRNT